MYIMGGNANGTYQNDVQYAAIGGNGAMLEPTTVPADWLQATVSGARRRSYDRRQGQVSVAYNGFLYIFRRPSCQQCRWLYIDQLLL